jgi:hypothetical protein
VGVVGKTYGFRQDECFVIFDVEEQPDGGQLHRAMNNGNGIIYITWAPPVPKTRS